MRGPDLRVLVVWEPILPTDWERPTSAVLARIHNRSVAQFWDHGHLVAHAISGELSSDAAGPKPHCCNLLGNLWDFAVLYPKGALWRAAPPQAEFADGPVAEVQGGLGRELATLISQRDRLRSAVIPH
jgi:hypothetical protein